MPQPPRFAPLSLWRAASTLLHTLFNLFGAPEALAARHTLLAGEHKLILNWLRCVECFVRHLLLIEASACAPPTAKPRARRKVVRARRSIGFDAEAPETWRVSFRALLPNAASGRGGHTFVGAAGRFRSAWPLAERFEALLRVHNDPAPFALRLARRLFALPRLFARTLGAPPELEHRVDPETYAALRVLHAERCLAFDSS